MPRGGGEGEVSCTLPEGRAAQGEYAPLPKIAPYCTGAFRVRHLCASSPSIEAGKRDRCFKGRILFPGSQRSETIGPESFGQRVKDDTHLDRPRGRGGSGSRSRPLENRPRQRACSDVGERR